MDDEPSHELELCTTRKKVAFSAFFFLRHDWLHLTCPFFLLKWLILLEICQFSLFYFLSSDTNLLRNFISIFSPPTWKKHHCRDPSSVEYNTSCLIIIKKKFLNSCTLFTPVPSLYHRLWMVQGWYQSLWYYTILYTIHTHAQVPDEGGPTPKSGIPFRTASSSTGIFPSLTISKYHQQTIIIIKKKHLDVCGVYFKKNYNNNEYGRLTLFVYSNSIDSLSSSQLLPD